jgi:hypothetical protein
MWTQVLGHIAPPAATIAMGLVRASMVPVGCWVTAHRALSAPGLLGLSTGGAAAVPLCSLFHPTQGLGVFQMSLLAWADRV